MDVCAFFLSNASNKDIYVFLVFLYLFASFSSIFSFPVEHSSSFFFFTFFCAQSNITIAGVGRAIGSLLSFSRSFLLIQHVDVRIDFLMMFERVN